MASAESQAVEAALTEWRDCQKKRDALAAGPERDALTFRCQELETAYQLSVAALFPDIELT